VQTDEVQTRFAIHDACSMTRLAAEGECRSSFLDEVFG